MSTSALVAGIVGVALLIGIGRVVYRRGKNSTNKPSSGGGAPRRKTQ